MLNTHIAIFGCGQLAQMTAQAGIKLGLTFSFIADPGEDTRCVEHLGDVVECTPGMTAKALFEALHRPQVFSVEKEMVDAELLHGLESLTRVYPSAASVKITQNRIREKNFVREHGIATADFVEISSTEQLGQAITDFGLPVYIKAAESGYDGYHQWRITDQAAPFPEALVNAITNKVELIAEKHVDYLREISVIAARSENDEIVFYPLMDNRHEDGVLISTVAPAPKQAQGLQSTAYDYMSKLLRAMDYVGVLTLECFETEAGIVVNELAPRVHNSGHWSIEGSATSQFENHSRAIGGLPLGSTNMQGVAGMVNMLGKHGNPEHIRKSNVFYHRYGKEERPRRKLGHVTLKSDNYASLVTEMNKVLFKLYAEQYPPLAQDI